MKSNVVVWLALIISVISLTLSLVGFFGTAATRIPFIPILEPTGGGSGATGNCSVYYYDQNGSFQSFYQEDNVPKSACDSKQDSCDQVVGAGECSQSFGT